MVSYWLLLRKDWCEKVRPNVMCFHLQLPRGIPGTGGELAARSRTGRCCFSFIFKVLPRVESQETRILEILLSLRHFDIENKIFIYKKFIKMNSCAIIDVQVSNSSQLT